MKQGLFTAVSVYGLALALSGPAEAAGYEYSTTHQPNLGQIGVTAALHDRVNGSGFGIAVFDTLADSTHVDLAGKTNSYLPYSGSYTTLPYHGTHVSGIAAAAENGLGIVGVAPGASLYNYAVFDDHGWVAFDYGKRALDSVRTLNGSGARIVSVNMSYGPSARGDIFITGELALFKQYKDDFVIVRSAGNDGSNAAYESYTGTASKDLSNLLIVGSVDTNNKISSFSTKPGTACISARKTCTASERVANFFIVAPGSNIVSDYPGQMLASASGTSMAAPHVAGAVALIADDAQSRNTLLTPTQIASIIKKSATDLGARGVDAVFGWGLLNVGAALAPVGGTTIVTTPTVQPAPVQATPKKKAAKSGKSRFSRKNVSDRSMLSGLVVFDEFGRPFEANTAALTESASPSLSQRGIDVLGLVSQQKTVDFDDGETAVLAWNATGADGEVTTAMNMVSGGTEISIGIGSPHLFLAAIPSSNRAGEPQRFSQIMYSSLGEAGEIFDDAMSVGFGTTLTDRLSANVFAVTESALETETAGLALTVPQAGTGSKADFAAIGLSYRVAENWSVGGSYALLRERGSVAGMVSDGALSLGEEALTQFQGVNLTGKIDGTWSLAAFYTRATIDSSGTQASLFDPADGWRGDHYGFMLDAKNALRENSLLRFSLTKPLQITSGTMSVRVPVGRELDGTVNYERRETAFDGSAMPLEAGVTWLAETGYGTIGFSLDLVDTNVNGAGERAFSAGAGFALEF
jgi:hypothetical protein